MCASVLLLTTEMNGQKERSVAANDNTDGAVFTTMTGTILV